jgi:hypothetical protein
MSFIIANFDPPPAVVTAANKLSKRFGPDATLERRARGWFLLQNELVLTAHAPAGPPVFPTVAAACSGSLHNTPELESALNISRSRARRRRLTDCALLARAYRAWGPAFLEHVRGEFAVALVDFTRERLVVASDVFATHPLWSAVWRDGNSLRIAASSLESSLSALGAPPETRIEARPNQVRALGFATGGDLWARSVKGSWDLRQYKMDTRDWQAAFERAVRRRTDELSIDAMTLSSGHDSGALLLALNRQGHRVRCYNTPEGVGSDARISAHNVQLRAPFCRRGLDLVTGSKLVPLIESEARWWQSRGERYLLRNFHNYTMGDRYSQISSNSSGGSCKGAGAAHLSAMASSAFLKRARADGSAQRVYLSCLGPDNSMATRVGRKSAPAEFFPANQSSIFPWKYFYSWQATSARDYLIAGANRMEARFPFLDVDVVQEFLWLHESVKNSEYKAPLAAFMREHGFAYRPNNKVHRSHRADRLEACRLAGVDLHRVRAWADGGAWADDIPGPSALLWWVAIACLALAAAMLMASLAACTSSAVGGVPAAEIHPTGIQAGAMFAAQVLNAADWAVILPVDVKIAQYLGQGRTYAGLLAAMANAPFPLALFLFRRTPSARAAYGLWGVFIGCGAASFSLLLMYRPPSVVLWLLGARALQGLGQGIRYTNLQVLALSTSHGCRTQYKALLNACNQIGYALGIGCAGAMLALSTSDADAGTGASAELTHGMLAVAVVVAVASILIVWLHPPTVVAVSEEARLIKGRARIVAPLRCFARMADDDTRRVRVAATCAVGFLRATQRTGFQAVTVHVLTERYGMSGSNAALATGAAVAAAALSSICTARFHKRCTDEGWASLADGVALGTLASLLLIRSAAPTVAACAVFSMANTISGTAVSANASKYAIEADRWFSTASISWTQTILNQCLGRVCGPLLSTVLYFAHGYHAYVVTQIALIALSLLITRAFVR